MNPQATLYSILQSTNLYYTSPGNAGYEKSAMSDAVLFHDTTRNIDFLFDLNPDTHTIQIAALHNTHTLKLYTPTISIGNRRLAPDIIMALHTAFTFDFASDAIITIAHNVVRTHADMTPPKTPQTPSDAIVAPEPIIMRNTKRLGSRLLRTLFFLRP